MNKVECAICSSSLIGMPSNEDCVAVPCGHVYHKNCIDDWLAMSNTCPECRKYVHSQKYLKLFFNTRTYGSQPKLIIPTLVINNTRIKLEKEKLRTKIDCIFQRTEQLNKQIIEARNFDNSNLFKNYVTIDREIKVLNAEMENIDETINLSKRDNISLKDRSVTVKQHLRLLEAKLQTLAC